MGAAEPFVGGWLSGYRFAPLLHEYAPLSSFSRMRSVSRRARSMDSCIQR